MNGHTEGCQLVVVFYVWDQLKVLREMHRILKGIKCDMQKECWIVSSDFSISNPPKTTCLCDP